MDHIEHSGLPVGRGPDDTVGKVWTLLDAVIISAPRRGRYLIGGWVTAFAGHDATERPVKMSSDFERPRKFVGPVAW
jgi:hypothetical protein